MPFQKIPAQKISDAVIEQVETLILQGVLRPGERLPGERDLAEAMEVSRPTVREALKSLEDRGLIVIRPGGGAFVAELLGTAFAEALVDLFASRDDAVFDYLEFRRDIEGTVAAHAAERASEADRAIICQIFERMEEAHAKRNPAEEAAIDADFHMCIVEAAHNAVMLHTMRSLYELLRRGVFYNRSILYNQRERRDALLNQHRAIRDGVISGEPERARQAVHAHLDYIIEQMRVVSKASDREEIARMRLEQETANPSRARPKK
ncbi:MAG: FCD domain-containing protein [Neomegalonema sp.]|nr:FCD domain-containing protein [Neomegalonema sp.]